MTATVLAPPRLTACPLAENNWRSWHLMDFCPLYVESHIARPGMTRHLGCVHDVAKPCQVERRRMDFAKAVARIRKIDPRLVGACEFRINAEQVRDKMRKERRAFT